MGIGKNECKSQAVWQLGISELVHTWQCKVCGVVWCVCQREREREKERKKERRETERQRERETERQRGVEAWQFETEGLIFLLSFPLISFSLRGNLFFRL